MATTVSTGDPKRKGQNDLDVTLSKKELEEQKMELLEKLKAAAKAPEQAERWIKELDKMVGNLRKNRHIVALQIESDEAELKQLKKQEEGLLIRLRPIQARLKENEKMAEKLREHIAMAVQKFDGFIQGTSASITKTKVADARQLRRDVRAQLIAERGYSTDRGSKPYKEPPRTSAFSRAGRQIASRK